MKRLHLDDLHVPTQRNIWYPLGMAVGLLAADLASRYFTRQASRDAPASDTTLSPETAVWAYPTAEDYAENGTQATDPSFFGFLPDSDATPSSRQNHWSYPVEEEKSYHDEPLPGQSFGERLNADDLVAPEDLEVTIETFPGYDNQ